MSRHQPPLHGQSPLAARAMPLPSSSHYQRPHSPNIRTRPSHTQQSSLQNHQHLRHSTITDGEERLYLRPPSPHSRLLLALLSPIREEISWALSRLIQASSLYPQHLVLSEWCGLADRLLSFVRRFNKAARGHADWAWANEEESVYLEAEEDSSDSEEDEEDDLEPKASTSTSKLRSTPLFDPRHDEEHFFILNAAISASLILRNASQDKANADFLTRDNANLPQIIFDVLSLPEDLFGFETPVDGQEQHLLDEEETRLEGVREMRLYWTEILPNIAPRIYLYQRSDVIRLQDGSVKRSSSHTDSHLATDEGAMVVRTAGTTSSHYTDRIFTHSLLLFYTTGDRALLLAIARFIAQLLSNARANPVIFVERPIAVNGKHGWSPGIVSRCKELIPLFALDSELAEAALDCLDASVDVALEDPETEEANQDAAQYIFPNALKVLATSASMANTSRPIRQPMFALLAQLLSVNASSWERVEALLLHSYLHPLHLIPSRRVHRERLLAPEYDFDAAAKARSYHALRSIKSESGLVDYTTPAEKRWLKTLEEPQRLKTWLKLVARPAGGPGSEERNPFYITQMQIWTSYRDTFAPLIDASHRMTAQDPSKHALPPLIPAYDVISEISKVFPTTAAVLVSEEDVRLGGTKFVIRGLEGYLRPELTNFKCRWRGCTQPQTATREAQSAHARAHAKLAADPAKCRWASCTYSIAAPVNATDDSIRMMLAAHILTHLPTAKDEGKAANNEPVAATSDTDGKIEQRQELIGLAVPSGRAIPLSASSQQSLTTESSPQSPSKVSPHAISGANPSRFTIDRPSSMRFHVYRTPFNLRSGVPEGPAASAARILQRIAHTCRQVLPNGTLGGLTADGHRLLGEDDDDIEREEKKVKLDFSDRLKAGERFGMPFSRPVNFVSLRDVASLQDQLDKKSEDLADVAGEGEDVSQLELRKAAELERTQRKLEAVESLQALGGIEEDMVKWAGQNDILSRQLLEALQDVAIVRAKDAILKRKRRERLF